MKIDETVTLLIAGDFTIPQTDTDVIPYPFGDFAYDSGVTNYWTCPCVDTVKNYYAIAAFPLLTVAQGNTYTVYVDGVVVTTGFTVLPDITLSGHRIAALKFATKPTGTVGVRCKGRAKNGIVLTNPVDIALEICNIFRFSGKLDGSAWEAARQACTAAGYVASGLILQTRTLRELLMDVMQSFLGSVFDTANGAASVAIQRPMLGNPNIVGTLPLGVLTDVEMSRSLDTACNRVTIGYALSYAETDRRTTTGVSKDGALGTVTQNHAVSQTKYGVCAQELTCRWVTTQAVAETIASTWLSLYNEPLWEVTGVDASLANLGIAVGQYVAFSWAGRQDETGRSLMNQIGYVLEWELDINTGALTLRMQDTGRFWYNMFTGMGVVRGDGTASGGAQREIRNL